MLSHLSSFAFQFSSGVDKGEEREEAPSKNASNDRAMAISFKSPVRTISFDQKEALR